MERKIVDRLIKLKNSSNRMSLVIYGARQVGKLRVIIKCNVDFVIQDRDGNIIPIEVKAADNVRSKSYYYNKYSCKKSMNKLR